MYVNLFMAMSCLYSTVNARMFGDDDDEEEEDLKRHLTTDPVCTCGRSIETAEYFFTLGYVKWAVTPKTTDKRGKLETINASPLPPFCMSVGKDFCQNAQY